MLQEAQDLQNRAVKDLVFQTDSKSELTFKAPTGSGKTYMMADMMNQILQEKPDVVFLVSSLSKGDLAEQNYLSFKDLSERRVFPLLDPYLINTEFSSEERPFIESNHNVYVLPRDLYKSGGILMRGVLEGLLQNITFGPLAGGQDKKVYLIKDECHIKTTNLDDISSSYFTKIYNFSATPKLSRGQIPDVEIKEDDAINAKLIKKVSWGIDTDSLEDAVKKDYRNKLGVNPCLIIQISNKDKAEEELRNTIFPVLNKDEHQDLKWMLIVDKDKDCDTNDLLKKLPVRRWKSYAKEPLSTIDIIIFKMTISEGWDIPRACMLYQIRDTQSKQLDEQVLGRIRRNPRLLDYENLDEEAQKLAMTAWAWGIVPKEGTKYQKVELKSDAEKEIQIKTTRLKPLNINNDFDVNNYLEDCEERIVGDNVFELYRSYTKSDNSVKNLAKEYVDSYDKWYKFVENLSGISKAVKEYSCDYEKSMILTPDAFGNPTTVSFPVNTAYAVPSIYDVNKFVNIANSVWPKVDSEDDIYGFDSEAETKWAKLLIKVSESKKLRKSDNLPEYYFWGKNYLDNSDIKYEYYLNGNHFSYPDFVMVDNNDLIHIFEVKSINDSSAFNFDSDEYKQKIEELAKCYKQASKLTGHIFYLPTMSDSTWKIRRFKDGIEDTITESVFTNSI